ncbi:MAG: hypothetical protein ABIZ04_15520 [Opitutus sp.]
MSLINEALKKAQRQRSDHPPGMPGADRMDQRAKPMGTQAIILIVAGAAVLVVFSVLITFYLVNRGSTAATPPVATVAKPAAVVEATPPPTTAAVAAPAISVPLVVPAAVESTASTTPPPPAVSALPPPVGAATSAPAATETVVAAVAAPPVAIPEVTTAGQPELKIQLFVDSIRVMGIRSSGGESKVLMNDRVFRVNDIVDRTLALKLVKVEPELLTFSDRNGMVYTKTF